MKNLFVLIFSFVGTASAAQNSVCYSTRLYNDVTCGVTTYEKEKLYAMEFVEIQSEDRGYVASYSFGTFKKGDGYIKFNDTLTDLEMVAEINSNGNIRFISGFDFMLNYEFERMASNSEIENKEIPAAYRNRAVDRETKTGPLLKTDRYFDKRNSRSLNIEKDGSFLYYLMGMALLKGTWSQKGNLIILHDKYTNHDYYLIYEEPNLRTMLLPGDWHTEGMVLKTTVDPVRL